HCAFGNQHDGVVAGIALAVVDEKLGELFDVEPVFGDDAAIGRARHRGKHGGEASIAAEDFEDKEAFVGTGRSAQGVGHLNTAGDTSAEADAVVGAGDIVVHGLGDGDNAHVVLIEAYDITERIVAADGDHVIDVEPGQVLQDLGREIV